VPSGIAASPIAYTPVSTVQLSRMLDVCVIRSRTVIGSSV
jgi:hypothetical protein